MDDIERSIFVTELSAVLGKEVKAKTSTQCFDIYILTTYGNKLFLWNNKPSNGFYCLNSQQTKIVYYGDITPFVYLYKKWESEWMK